MEQLELAGVSSVFFQDSLMNPLHSNVNTRLFTSRKKSALEDVEDVPNYPLDLDFQNRNGPAWHNCHAPGAVFPRCWPRRPRPRPRPGNPCEDSMDAVSDDSPCNLSRVKMVNRPTAGCQVQGWLRIYLLLTAVGGCSWLLSMIA